MRFDSIFEKSVIVVVLLIFIVGFLIVIRADQIIKCGLVANNDDFKEIQERVYVQAGSSQLEVEEVKGIMETAYTRNKELFGFYVDRATFIFVESVDEAESFGGTDYAVTTGNLFGIFVIVGPEGFNEDIVSHEMVHGELASRLGWRKSQKLPVWFNEGLATQVDYREGLSEELWLQITNDGQSVPDVEKLTSPDVFYHEDHKISQINYVLAKFRVKEWYVSVGQEGLNQFIETFRSEGEFDTAFSY